MCAHTASLRDRLSVSVGPPALSVSETPTYAWESGLALVIARVFRSARPDAAGFTASCRNSLCRNRLRVAGSAVAASECFGDRPSERAVVVGEPVEDGVHPQAFSDRGVRRHSKAQSCERLEVGAYDAGHPIDLGHLENVGRRRLPLAEAVSERLDGNVGADGIPVAETVGDRLRRARHLHEHTLDLVLLDTGGERKTRRPDNAYGGAGDGRAMGRLVDHDPDGMRHLRRQAVILESRHEADDCLRGSRGYGSDVGVAGRRMVGPHVDAACPTDDVAAIDRTLEGNTRNAERLELPRAHNAVPLKVSQKSVNMAGDGHGGCGMGVTNTLSEYI